MDSNTQLGSVMAGLASAGKLTANDKRWLTQKIDEQRAFEGKLKFIDACATNPDLPFLFMFLGGLTLNTAVKLVEMAGQGDQQATAELEKLTTGDKGAILFESAFKNTFGMLFTPQLTNLGWKLLEKDADAMFGSKKDEEPDTWVGFAVSSVRGLSISVSAFAASILVMRAIFGNSSKDGGMASLAGLLVK